MRINGGGTHQHNSSFGDIIARVKYALTANDAPVQVALDPFVKLPTADHRLGNGKVEAGMLVATSASLGRSGLTLSLDPELDWVADAEGAGTSSHSAGSQPRLRRDKAAELVGGALGSLGLGADGYRKASVRGRFGRLSFGQ